MKKNRVTFLCALIMGALLLLTSCAGSDTASGSTSSETSSTDSSNTAAVSSAPVSSTGSASSQTSTPVSSAASSKAAEITQDQAVSVLEDEYGTVDSQTGNELSYSYLATVQDAAGTEYYAFRMSWLVDHSHLSFLQNVFVSKDGQTIRNSADPAGYSDGDVVSFDN